MQFDLEQLVIPSGHQVLLKDVSWQDFEQLLEAWEKTGKKSRIAYSQGWIEFMSPLAVHEDDKIILGNLVEILLEELDIEFRNLGSITLKSPQAKKSVEPDECFYIQHEAFIRGKAKIDLDIDPPPDLAIEIDITNRTHFDHYEKIGVPELWRYTQQGLEILLLSDGVYLPAEYSRQFPHFDLKTLLPAYLEKSKQIGRNTAMRAFRQLVKGVIAGNPAVLT